MEINRRQFLGGTAIAISAVGAERADDPFAVVLGTAQDGGFPQAGCKKDCCKNAWAKAAQRRDPACLGIVEPLTGERFFIECTPSFPRQLKRLNAAHRLRAEAIGGILLTHAHIGHYAGLIHLGREVMGIAAVPVFAMPRMEKFLRTHGPWSQLVKLENISLKPMRAGHPFALSPRLKVTPLLVPHRDEFSETVAFRISGPRRSILWLPDIDKWTRWKTPLEKALETVDVAYLDGTFFADGELPGRDMSKIPHPFITETMRRLKSQPAATRTKVRFIHLNHTNPAHQPDSPAAKTIRAAGFRVAAQGEMVNL